MTPDLPQRPLSETPSEPLREGGERLGERLEDERKQAAAYSNHVWLSQIAEQALSALQASREEIRRKDEALDDIAYGLMDEQGMRQVAAAALTTDSQPPQEVTQDTEAQEENDA